eukprot:scaffold3240_cov187-Amphora_coffeaeformis.AAC.25
MIRKSPDWLFRVAENSAGETSDALVWRYVDDYYDLESRMMLRSRKKPLWWGDAERRSVPQSSGSTPHHISHIIGSRCCSP